MCPRGRGEPEETHSVRTLPPLLLLGFLVVVLVVFLVVLLVIVCTENAADVSMPVVLVLVVVCTGWRMLQTSAQ